MKKLSLLSLLGLAAFIAMPIYAQDVEEDIILNDEPVVAETEDVAVADDESDYGVNEEALDPRENIDASIDDLMWMIDEEVEVSNVTFEGISNGEELSEEELKAMLHEWAVSAWLTDEQATMIVGFLLGLGLAGLIVFLIIGFIFRILKIIALWKAFNKAGEGGWKAIIPIYCSYIKYKLAWMKSWFWYGLLIAVIMWIIAAFVPDQQQLLTDIACAIVWIIYIIVTFKFARKFGWGVFTSILFVLFYPICILILGFGSSKYQGKTVVEA